MRIKRERSMYDSQLGAPMLMLEFATIISLIRQRCLYADRLEGVSVSPVIDLQTKSIRVVTVIWKGGGMAFDVRDSPRSLYERMLEWVHEFDKIEGEK